MHAHPPLSWVLELALPLILGAPCPTKKIWGKSKISPLLIACQLLLVGTQGLPRVHGLRASAGCTGAAAGADHRARLQGRCLSGRAAAVPAGGATMCWAPGLSCTPSAGVIGQACSQVQVLSLSADQRRVRRHANAQCEVKRRCSEPHPEEQNIALQCPCSTWHRCQLSLSVKSWTLGGCFPRQLTAG